MDRNNGLRIFQQTRPAGGEQAGRAVMSQAVGLLEPLA